MQEKQPTDVERARQLSDDPIGMALPLTPERVARGRLTRPQKRRLKELKTAANRNTLAQLKREWADMLKRRGSSNV